MAQVHFLEVPSCGSFMTHEIVNISLKLTAGLSAYVSSLVGKKHLSVELSAFENETGLLLVLLKKHGRLERE